MLVVRRLDCSRTRKTEKTGDSTDKREFLNHVHVILHASPERRSYMYSLRVRVRPPFWACMQNHMHMIVWYKNTRLSGSHISQPVHLATLFSPWPLPIRLEAPDAQQCRVDDGAFAPRGLGRRTSCSVATAGTRHRWSVLLLATQRG